VLKTCERTLKTPDTNWDSIYFRLRTSVLGEDFPRDRFVRTPIGAIVSALQYIDDEEQRLLNLSSSATAKLAVQVVHIAHAMSGSRGRKPKVQIKDFLPFPDWCPESSKKDGPDIETKKILTDLLKKRKISMAVYAQLVTPPDASR